MISFLIWACAILYCSLELEHRTLFDKECLRIAIFFLLKKKGNQKNSKNEFDVLCVSLLHIFNDRINQIIYYCRAFLCELQCQAYFHKLKMFLVLYHFELIEIKYSRKEYVFSGLLRKWLTKRKMPVDKMLKLNRLKENLQSNSNLLST